MFFVTIESISHILRRNMVLESMHNILLYFRLDIKKLQYCISKLCLYIFWNVRQERQEFTYSNFSNIVNKQNRRIRLNFKSNVKVLDK